MEEERVRIYKPVIDYLRNGFALSEDLARHCFSDNKELAELLMLRSEEFVYGLTVFDHSTQWPEDVHEGFKIVIKDFQEYIARIKERFHFFEDDDDLHYHCPYGNQEARTRARAGRPRFLIPKVQLEGLRSLHFNWNNIAKMLGVSERTIRRRREELGMEIGQKNSYSNMPDHDLDIFVGRILHYSPNSGERMVLGALKSQGVKVQRERVRQSIGRIDPVSRELRRKTAIHRRVYSVRTPNALWHIDGNHKMIRWRFVVHGGIDGFSRSVVFLACSCNNRSETVLDLFVKATETFKCPRRVRSDHGTENVDVARWMLHRFGVAAKPCLTGLSVHNQRIERLWKDVNTYVISYFRNLFYYLESLDLLNPLDEVHLFALHYVFKPWINRALTIFVSQWNNHPLSSEGNKAPYQLWVQGFYQFANSDHETVRDMVNTNTLDALSYGVDDEGPLSEVQTANHVAIPEPAIALTEEETVALGTLINPLEDDNEHGKLLYKTVCEIVQNCLSQRNT